MTERAQRIMEAFYLTFTNKRQDFIIQKLNNDALAAVIREIVNEFHENEVDVMNENTIYGNPFDY